VAIFKRFVAMVQFFTSIPVPINLNCDERDYGKGLVFAPAVGLIIGVLILALCSVLKLFLPAKVVAAFLIVGYIVLTGGLHLDGLGDTFDGLFSNRPKERILEIMRDSRVGTNAVLALISIVLLNYTVLLELDLMPMALLLFPVAGRIGSLIGAGSSVYARKNEGLGKSFIDFCGKKEMILGSVISFIIFGIVLKLKGLLMAFISIVTAWTVTKILTRKLGGATGDILGAICELNQTVFLILFFVLEKFLS